MMFIQREGMSSSNNVQCIERAQQIRSSAAAGKHLGLLQRGRSRLERVSQAVVASAALAGWANKRVTGLGSRCGALLCYHPRRCMNVAVSDSVL
jgi:hypothetical protein